MNRTTILILFATTIVGLCSCSKGIKRTSSGSASAAGGIYVLAQGGTDTIKHYTSSYTNYNTYLSTLAYYNAATGTVTPDRFSQVNGEPLGFMAMDMGVYGSK